MILYGISGAGIVGLVVVVLIVALAGGGSNAKAAIKTIRAQGCQYHKYPALPRTPHYSTMTPEPAAQAGTHSRRRAAGTTTSRCPSGCTPR